MKPGSQLARAALLLPLLLGLGQGAEFRKFKTNVPAEVSAALHALLLLHMQLLRSNVFALWRLLRDCTGVPLMMRGRSTDCQHLRQRCRQQQLADLRT
eukprot:19368-Heterococcus_DN1.PRE.1